MIRKIPLKDAQEIVRSYLIANDPSTAISIRDGLGDVARTFPRYIHDIIRSMYLEGMLVRIPIEGSRKYLYDIR